MIFWLCAKEVVCITPVGGCLSAILHFLGIDMLASELLVEQNGVSKLERELAEARSNLASAQEAAAEVERLREENGGLQEELEEYTTIAENNRQDLASWMATARSTEDKLRDAEERIARLTRDLAEKEEEANMLQEELLALQDGHGDAASQLLATSAVASGAPGGVMLPLATGPRRSRRVSTPRTNSGLSNGGTATG